MQRFYFQLPAERGQQEDLARIPSASLQGSQASNDGLAWMPFESPFQP